MIDETVRDIVSRHVSQHEQERLAERYRAAVYDRTLDVCATIAQPFAFRDVFECVRHVLDRDGWTTEITRRLSNADAYTVARRALADLEAVDLVARIRYGAGPRAHMWVRADRGPGPR